MTNPTENDPALIDPTMVDRGTESKPLRERLAPQTSIRFLFILIGVSAVVMLIFRSAVDGSAWARIAALLIWTTAGCFVTYAGLFLIANLFSLTTAPLAQALESASEPRAAKRKPETKKLVGSDTGDREKP